MEFDATPEVGTAPWCNRESSRLKMMQSLTDYLTERCNASNVSIVAIADIPVVEKPKRKIRAKASTF